MKHIIHLMILFTLSILSACTKSTTHFFGDTNHQLSNVAQVKKLYDGSYVTLEGYLIEQIGYDEFQFKDFTNNHIRVEIQDHVWNGLVVSDKDKVKIQGRLAKSFGISKLVIYYLEKI